MGTHIWDSCSAVPVGIRQPLWEFEYPALDQGNVTQERKKSKLPEHSQPRKERSSTAVTRDFPALNVSF